MSRSDCSGGMSCIDFRCTLTGAAQKSGKAKSRLGLGLVTSSGIGGHLANGSTGVSVGPDASIALGAIRWHLFLGYESLNGYNGVRIELLDFGVPFRIPVSLPYNAQLEIEPVLFNTVEALGNNGHQILGSSMLGVQANVAIDRFYLSVLPIGIEMHDWTVEGDSQDTTVTFGIGFDYVFRLSAGMQF